jgi:hypothetical protein
LSGERPSPIERMSTMTVVEAAKPLYDSLTDAQKQDWGRLMREFKRIAHPSRRHL